MAIAVDYGFDDETLDGLKFENYVQHFKIEDRRTGQLVPFVLNPVQIELRAIIDEKLAAGEARRPMIARRFSSATADEALPVDLGRWRAVQRVRACERLLLLPRPNAPTHGGEAPRGRTRPNRPQ